MTWLTGSRVTAAIVVAVVIFFLYQAGTMGMFGTSFDWLGSMVGLGS
jgi:hypothetical protein